MHRSVYSLTTACLSCLLALTLASPLPAAPPMASSSRQTRDEATGAIPFTELKADVRARIRQVVQNPTIFRRLPTQIIHCDPDLYLFLVRYPEVVVNMWDLMGITKVKVQRSGMYTLNANDGSGTSSRVELVYGTPDTHVLYAEGVYEGPLLKRRITGRCVLLLKSGYVRGDDDRMLISHRLDVFVQLDNVGADLVARTLQPLVGKTADHNFAQSTKFLSQISQQAEVNGPGIQRLATRLTKVDPVVRDKFSSLAAEVTRKAADRGTEPDEALGSATADPLPPVVTRRTTQRRPNVRR